MGGINTRRALIFVSIAALSVSGCYQNPRHEKAEEIAISRAFEQAIELGEKIISEKELIENVALTQSTNAAVKLHDSLGHRDNIDLLWEKVKQIEELCNHVTDTLAQKEIISHLYPYAEKLDELLEQIH